MKTLVPFLAVSLLVLPTMPGQGQEGKEQEKLEGKWKLVSKQAAAGAGHTFELYSFLIGANGGTLEIKGDKFITRIGKETTELNIAVDTTKSPKTVDAKVGKDKIVIRGIYELKKDSLRLCVSGKGSRPKEFKNSLDTPLFEYKRE